MRFIATRNATSVGTEAHRALRLGAVGRVEAVFERSLYVSFQDGWVCIGELSIGRGPINIVVAPAAGARLAPSLHSSAIVEESALRLGEFRLDTADAVVWQPEPLPHSWAPTLMEEGLRALLAALPVDMPMEGLGAYLRPGTMPVSRTARAAAPAIAAIAAWLVTPDAAAPPPVSAVQGLLGLGPGLTPSGDDFLAGVLATLHLLKRTSKADALWAVIERHAPCVTGEISGAHLRASHRSGLGEPLHRLLLDTLLGNVPGIRHDLTALHHPAHCSPWDALAGCLIVLSRGSRENRPF